MTTETPKLLPCPFCGGPARMHEYVHSQTETQYRIDCDLRAPHGSCSAIATTGYVNTEAAAIAAWNRRHADREMVERLKAKCTKNNWQTDEHWFSLDEIIAELEREGGE